jgi:predicted acetyltransferase
MSASLPAEDALSLEAPTLRREAAFWAMVAEFDAAVERFFSQPQRDFARRNFAAYVGLLEAQGRGEHLAPGHVPGHVYWLVRASTEVVGTSRLRHFLTPALADIGGHIGYDIRPSARRRGYGTRLLALTLERARALGLDRVLLTCSTDNVGSARVIERNGGVLASQGISPASGKPVARYWIAL